MNYHFDPDHFIYFDDFVDWAYIIAVQKFKQIYANDECKPGNCTIYLKDNQYCADILLSYRRCDVKFTITAQEIMDYTGKSMGF